MSKRLFRYRIVVGFLALFAGFVVVRYAYLAATPAKADAAAAADIERGTIADRGGRVLAMDSPLYDVAVWRPETKKAAFPGEAAKLSAILVWAFMAVLFFLMMRTGQTYRWRRIFFVALGFLFLGKSVFAAVSVSVSDFQIAGGLILFILAARELTQAESAPANLQEDFGIVPLGMPLIAGPALITTLLLLVETQGMPMTLVALALNLGIVVLAFVCSEWLGRRIGEMGLRAISKIIAMLLAAIAIAMIRRGWAR